VDAFAWLSFGYGVAGFALAAALLSLARRHSMPVSKERYQTEVLDLLKRKLDLQAEQIGIDERLANLWEHAPEPRARWIVRSLQEARMLPPRLVQLAYRYGFAVPGEGIMETEYGAAAEPEPEDESAEIVALSAWGGGS